MKTAIKEYENIDKFLEQLFSDETVLIELEIKVVCKNKLLFKIEFNDNIIHNEEYCSGNYNLSLTTRQNRENNLQLELYNLNKHVDTESFIEIQNFYINKYDVLRDYDFFYSTFYYKINNLNVKPMPGFWDNSILGLNFKFPFNIWYHESSTKSREVPGTMKSRGTSSPYEVEIQNLLDVIEKIKV